MTVQGLEFGIRKPTKRKNFVSYHHHNDREFYNQFVQLFKDSYELIHDNSVDRIIDSDDAEYIIRNIRENYLTGSSCTVVLCGKETPYRKFVDWEIKATLDKEHGLIGINLPTNPLNGNGKCVVPGRLLDNINSGYAMWIQWNTIVGNPRFLTNVLNDACQKLSKLIMNSREIKRSPS